MRNTAQHVTPVANARCRTVALDCFGPVETIHSAGIPHSRGRLCYKSLARLGVLALAALLGCAPFAAAQTDATPPKPVRELFVPFKDLDAILEKQPQRVLLKREEFLELLAKAKHAAETHAPIATAILSADYSAAIGIQRAQITGSLTIDCLEKGVQGVPLDLQGLSILRATLDGADAPIATANPKDNASPLLLLVDGVGRHELKLEMVAPLETTASQQILRFRLPQAAAVQLRLTAPGDVEIKSGAEILRREVDAAAKVTRFEVLPHGGDMAIAMTLNSHLQRQERAVVANTVALHEVTQAYEKLHVAVSLQILYKAVDRFRFALPAGFEVLEVNTPLLARWEVADENGTKVLAVQLREQTTDPVAINISAIKTPATLENWTAPQLKPLDVAGHVAVVGLLVEDRLRSESIAAKDLIPIDVAALRNSMPESVLKAAPGAPALRPVAAWYAPDGGGSLSANFAKPPAGLAVTTNLVLKLTEQGQEIDGALAVLPEVEKRFSLGFSVPALWYVDRVTGPNGQPLPFEHYGEAGKAGRIEVRLPAGIPADQEYQLRFHAAHTPEGWLDRWEKSAVIFPAFVVVGATRDEGALAVAAAEDMEVRPDKTDKLTPLLEPEKPHYGLAGVATRLAWRYETPGHQASLIVTRSEPRVTARTFAFFQVKPDVLGAHYELAYQVDEARIRELTFVLPADTPKAISIHALDGVRIKDPKSEDDGDLRRWTVLLEDARRDKIRLAVDFDQNASKATGKPVELPMIAADAVAYQSGLVAVEGSAELNVQVKTDARQVDVGELVEADYQPGRRLLGVYGFVGDPPAVRVVADRTPTYALYPALVERAVLDTYLAAEGKSQTEANFTLKTKTLLLELKLPDGAALWSATLDGQPIKPQQEGNSLLMSFPAANAPVARQLQFVYDADVQGVLFSGKVEVPAPTLMLHGAPGTPPEEVPLGDLVWRLHLPTGYKVTRSLGSVSTTQLDRPVPAAVGVATFLYELAGGVHPFYGVPQAATRISYDAAKSSREMTRGAASVAQSEYKSADEAPDGEKSDRLERFNSLVPEAAKPADEPAACEPTIMAPADMNQAPEETPTGEPFLGNSIGQPPQSESGVIGAIVLDEASVPKAEPPMPPADPFSPATATPALPAVTTPQSGSGYFQPIEGQVPPAPRTPPPARRNLLGMRSLKIDLAQMPSENTIVLRSLGEQPRLIVRLARSAHIRALGAGLAMLSLLWGFMLTRSSALSKVRYVLGVLLFATLLPFLWLSTEVADVSNAVFYAASALVPYYLLVGLVSRCARRLTGGVAITAKPGAAALLVLALSGMVLSGAASAAEPAPPGADKYIVQVIEPSQPLQIPDDAIVIPFDPSIEDGTPTADRLLVPYARFVELWNLAYPDRKIDEKPAPAPYALSGAAYRATLAGDDFVLLSGTLNLDVFAEGFVQVPLQLAGGVLAGAELDGKPARLQTLEAQPPVAQPAAQSAKAAVPPPNSPLVVLYLSGKGRHKLDLAVRMKIARQGGWRSIDGALPTAPAAVLDLGVPEAQTEVRLGQVADRRSYDTEKAAEEIHTALGPEGKLSIQWRPKIAEGQVDQALTAQSSAVLNVEEDGLRLQWRVSLDFRRSQRERFTVLAPKGCLIERVEGPNVRGWTLKDGPERQTVEVELLKAAKDHEEFTVAVWRAGKVGVGDLTEFDVPVIEVSDAALSSGEVTVCRSPLLDLRAVDAKGASRVDLSENAVREAAQAAAMRPLGVRPFQAYRFATMPFTLRLAAEPKTLDLSATVQSVMKIADIGNTLVTHIQLDPKGRPVHEVQILLPPELALENVSTPGEFHWAVTLQNKRPLLTVYLAAGRQESQEPTAITLRGRLAKGPSPNEAPLPQIEVLGARRQEGAIAVQIDPAYDIQATKLLKCETVLLSRLYGWLKESQREVTRLGIEYREPNYSGALKLTVRKPEVSCDTVTNVRFTPTAIEETIALYYEIRDAGVRSIAFSLPPSAAGASISVPMLRQKKLQTQPDGSVRVVIDFQEEVMGELRVLVQNDRALVRGAECSVALAKVENAKLNRSYIALESAGRDEVESVSLPKGIEALGRSTKQWQALQTRLGGGNITQAWLVRDPAAQPLAFRLQEREAVKTAGARILLAQAEIVVDSVGAYRAQQVYKINNTTEQYLEVQLPQDAQLWTARVAAEPVKPKQAGDKRSVRIPLVKTAVGELDYEVVLRYGGKMDNLGALTKVDFPLMRTKSIQPESSLLSLYVPKSHEWLRFDGTMHEVFDEAALENEKVLYQNKLTQTVLEASRQGDINTKIRAANSLKTIQSGNPGYSSSMPSGNTELRNNLSANAALMQQADVEVRKLEESLQETGEAGNRDRLNDAFVGQQLSRARNVVQDVGDNWAMSEQPAPETAPAKPGAVQFNEGWFANNGFVQTIAPANQPPSGDQGGKPQAGEKIPSEQSQGKVIWKGKSSASGKPKSPQIAQQQQQQMEQQQSLGDLPNASFGNRRNSDEDRQKGQKYYDRVQRQQAGLSAQQLQANGGDLSVQQGVNANNDAYGFNNNAPNMPAQSPALQPPTTQPPNAPPYTIAKPVYEPRGPQPTENGQRNFHFNGSMGNARESGFIDETVPGNFSADLDVPFGGQGGMGGGLGGMGGMANAPGGPMLQNPVTGLASLEIDLPLRDDIYEIHRFVTPRGEVDLQAYAASRDRIKSLVSIFAVLAVVLAGWGIFHLTRRGAKWITGPYGSTVLLVLGVASLFTGVLPVAGVTAMIAGAIIKLRRWLTPKVIVAEAAQ